MLLVMNCDNEAEVIKSGSKLTVPFISSKLTEIEVTSFSSLTWKVIVKIPVFEQIPNIGPNRIPKYYSEEQIDWA